MLKILEYIKKQKIPLKYFKERTGYSPQYISGVLNGHKNPSHAFKLLFFGVLLDVVRKEIEENKQMEEALCLLLQYP